MPFGSATDRIEFDGFRGRSDAVIVETSHRSRGARQNRMKLVYWNNIPSPYMIERFNILADRGNVEFQAWFSERTEADRSWMVDESTWRFPYAYLGTGLSGLQSACEAMRRVRPDVLVSLYDRPEYVGAMSFAKSCGCRVAFHAMKTFDSWVRRRHLREAAKYVVFPHVDAFQVPGTDAARYVERYGARPESIWILPEPVNVARFSDCGGTPPNEALFSTRRGCTFLYVGRLWEGKGLAYLLDAFEYVAGLAPDVRLVVAGDGIDEQHFRERADNLNVCFLGFVHDELPEIYKACDVLVFPTLGDPYGHVIQEAMASGLPVISTTAAGEIADRVIDGVTGFLVPPAQSQALAAAMLVLARDPPLRDRMGKAGFQKISSRTVEWWTGAFEEFAIKSQGRSEGKDLPLLLGASARIGRSSDGTTTRAK